MAIKLGSTLNDFINAVNNNSADTEGIIQGTKKVKRISFGEENELGSIEYNYDKENDTKEILLKGLSVAIQSNPHEQGWGSKVYCDRGLINIFADSDINIRSDDGTRFYGNVDFTNATVTGLPSSGGGLDISPAIIEYNNEEDYLNIKNPNGSINIHADDSIYFTVEAGDIVFESKLALPNGAWFGENSSTYFEGETTFENIVDFTNATVIGLPSGGGEGGSLDLDADYNWDGNHTFNNGITLNGNLTLANNGEINDREDSLTIYKGTGSMWIGTENGGSIDINDDEMRVESYNHLTLSGNGITFGAVEGIGIYVGENDDTYFELSPTEFNVYANNGDINFSSSNGISFITGLDALTWFNLYEDEQSCYFNIDLNDGLSILRFSCDKETEETSFYCDANTINFANTQRVNVGNELNIGVRGAKIVDEGYLAVRDNENLWLITEDEEGNYSSIDMYADHIEYDATTHKFYGELDLSEASITGLPSSGGGKTKITLAELRTMLTNNATTYGKLIQFVFKGDNLSKQWLKQAINSCGLVHIVKGSSSLETRASTVNATESSIAANVYSLYINASDAKISVYAWDYSIQDNITNVGEIIAETISDVLFDIYIIGD